jgi:hypothetical protein
MIHFEVDGGSWVWIKSVEVIRTSSDYRRIHRRNHHPGGERAAFGRSVQRQEGNRNDL